MEENEPLFFGAKFLRGQKPPKIDIDIKKINRSRSYISAITPAIRRNPCAARTLDIPGIISVGV